MKLKDVFLLPILLGTILGQPGSHNCGGTCGICNPPKREIKSEGQEDQQNQDYEGGG